MVPLLREDDWTQAQKQRVTFTSLEEKLTITTISPNLLTSYILGPECLAISKIYQIAPKP
jgi:hypothetical protein